MRSNGLRDELFTPETMNRLRSVADIVSDDTLTDLTSPASRAALHDIDVLITGWGSGRIDTAVLDAAPDLRLIAHAAGTVKSFIDRACWERGIAVTSAAEANAYPVAEFTVAMILLAGKRAFLARDLLADHRSRWQKTLLPSPIGNYRTTVGIVGASRVGRRVIDLLAPFDIDVQLADPTVSAAEALRLGAELVDLDTLMSANDIVSIHAPLLPSTRGMIGTDQIQAMHSGCTLINTARGAIVDQAALTDRLRTGTIAAILDVTDPEPLDDDDDLYTLPNVFLTPHIAGSLGNETARLGAMAVAEVEQFAAGSPLNHPILATDLDSIG